MKVLACFLIIILIFLMAFLIDKTKECEELKIAVKKIKNWQTVCTGTVVKNGIKTKRLISKEWWKIQQGYKCSRRKTTC